MSALRFLFVLALFVFPFHALAQITDDSTPTTDQATAEAAAKEKLRQENALLEQILADAKNLRLPENRALIYAKVGNALWQTDEKRARELFQNSISDLITAQTEAENDKAKNKQYLNNLIYGQSPRWDILNTIAARDADFALDALIKTRPTKISQAIANLNSDNQTSNPGYARNEIQAEQRLIAQAAEQNPQRAIKLLRESLKKDVTYESISLLKRIFQKEPDTANQLAEEVGQKLLDRKLDEDNQDSSLIQTFLADFGQEKTAENNPSIKVSDQLLRSLSEKVLKFTLRPNATSLYVNQTAQKVIEKYFPSSATQIQQKQAKLQNQGQNAQYEGYNKLLQSDSSSEELISQADKFPRGWRNELYRRAAQKTAESGNFAEAQKIITSNLSEDEAENYLSQLNYNLATQAIGNGKFNEANQFISQIADENLQLNTLVYLANAIYQKDPKENQKWASSVLDQARMLIAETPEKTSDINALVSIAAAYAPIDSSQSFRMLDSIAAPLNELSEASAIVAKYNDYGNFRQGEYQISAGANPINIYNLPGLLKTLKDKDFDRTLQFVTGFSRLDVRVSLEIQLINSNFFNQELPTQGRKFTSILN